MTANPRSALRGVPFRFHYYGPRLRAGLLIALIPAGLWLAAHPRDFDVVSLSGRNGSIDRIMQMLSDPWRAVACVTLDGYLFYLLMTYYVPCLRFSSLLMFDGRQLRGFRAWGREGTLLLSEVERVIYRGGYALVRGRTMTLWIPLSSLDMDRAERQAARAMLDDAAR